MTDNQKAGQFFIFSIGGTSVDSNLKIELEKFKPSGVIYMGYNIYSKNQTSAFSKDIQKTNKEIPLFISTDQEGGVVKRVSWDNTDSEKNWINLSDEEICNQSKTRANVLNEIGINLNFAPVVDLSILGGGFINNRTISNDPNIVIKKAEIFIKCSQENNVYTTLKHYPGHGSTDQDSHFHLPQINKTKEDWLISDGKPFKGLNDSKFIMLGHLVFNQIDSSNPATLSKILVTDILKNEFKYKGLIITDDMNMLYTSTKIQSEDMIVKALNAGVDQLLFVGFPKTKENLIEITSNAIKSKEISPQRIEESLLKILIAKRDLR